MFGRFKKFTVNYDIIPWATFTDPEVTRVGINEKDAANAGIDCEVVKYNIKDLDRAIADCVEEKPCPGKNTQMGKKYHAWMRG